MYNYNPITQLQPISSLSPDDLFAIVDVTDNTQSPVGTTKKVTIQQIGNYIMLNNAWITVTAGPVTLQPNTGYISNGLSLIIFTLPLTANVGDSYLIRGVGPGLFQIGQNVGQQTIFGAGVTSIGTGGYILSTNVGDCINIQCWATNTSFIVSTGPVGNYTVV
jgi:hypothetical protein